MPKRCGDAVRIGRFRQIVQRARLYSGNCGGDVAEAGQHHDFAFRPFGAELGDKAQAAAIFEFHVQDGIGRRRFADTINALGHRTGVCHLEATRFHSPPKPVTERSIVIKYQ